MSFIPRITGFVRQIIHSLLCKIIDRLPEKLPDAEEESLPEELRAMLEKLRLRVVPLPEEEQTPPEGAVDEDEVLGEESSDQPTHASWLAGVIGFFRGCFEWWCGLSKVAKIILLSVVPVFFCYFILDAVLVGSTPQISKEDEFRHLKGKPLVRLTYVSEWPASVAFSRLLAKILQNNLNTDVIFKPVHIDGYRDMWSMLLNNKADICLSVVMPDSEGYIAEAGDNVVDLGSYLMGARMGLAVPSYVKADTIKDLKPEEFSGVIYGIDPDSVLNRRIYNAIEDYGLKGFRVIEKNDRVMLDNLQQAIKDNKPIVVGLWTPHWAFGFYNLKMLADPLGVMGDSGSINMVCSRSFFENFSETSQAISRIRITSKQLSTLINDMKNETFPGKAVYDWLKANKAQVNRWLNIPSVN